jgi:membrane protease YdiL (CAAX protease family)
LLKNIVFFAMGKFRVEGWMDGAFIASLMAQAAVAMLLASAINDLMIRGYWFAWCTRAGRLRWFVGVATVLYVLDDGWNAGFAPLDLAFSTVLGIALAWTVLKTGRIWMSIGIHWGGNLVYRAMSGFDGRGVVRLADVQQGTRYEVVAVLVTALLIPAAWWLLRERRPALPAAEAA